MNAVLPFEVVPEDGGRLRLIVVGAGPMGRAWLRTIAANPDVELVGIADLAVDLADEAAVEAGFPGLPTGTDAVELVRRTGAHAVVNVTVPAAHHPVTTAALLAGVPVLGEKPVASTVAEGLSLAAAAELTGQLFMVSQSRRYNAHLFAARAQAAALGRIGILSVDFFKAPRFGGFRDEMTSPLLLDMAIHQFDMARFLLDRDPVSVICEEYNPAWSWYRGNASATAVFEFEGGTRFVYNGSWCSPGLETSWNGSWRLSAERGTVLWDGDNDPEWEANGHGTDLVADVTAPGSEIEGSLREFVAALRTGVEPMGRAPANVLSLAMVEAAVLSARTGRRVALDEIMDRSYQSALEAERNPDVLAVMTSWPSVGEGLNPGRSRF